MKTINAARTSETLVNFYQTTRCYNPEDSNLHTHRRENLKSYFINLKSAYLPGGSMKNSEFRTSNSNTQNLLRTSNFGDYDFHTGLELKNGVLKNCIIDRKG
jgi:hypothetical protein